MNSCCTVLLNTDQYPPHLQQLLDSSDLVIATDGAWNQCQMLGIDPDVILGDMDSMTNYTSHSAPDHKMLYIADQNTTDGEKAIRYALDKGYSELRLVGVIGTRLDHSLYHIQLMQGYHSQFTKITGYTATEVCFIATSKQRIRGQPQQRLSLLNLSSTELQVRTQGLGWPVSTLKNHSVSNYFQDDLVEIEPLSNAPHLLITLGIVRSC